MTLSSDPVKAALTRQRMKAYWTEEKRQKRGEESKRMWQIPEYRNKLLPHLQGERHPLYGKHHKPESKAKMRLQKLGKFPSEETRLKLSKAHKGLRHTPEVCKIIADSRRGEKNNWWKGGISFEPYCPKFTREFKERVRVFFGHKCVTCGKSQEGEKLHVHHVNFNKNTCCDNSIPLFVALCRSCHAKTQGDREFYEEWFTAKINCFHGGNCYIPKPELVATPDRKKQIPCSTEGIMNGGEHLRNSGVKK